MPPGSPAPTITAMTFRRVPPIAILLGAALLMSCEGEPGDALPSRTGEISISRSPIEVPSISVDPSLGDGIGDGNGIGDADGVGDGIGDGIGDGNEIGDG